MSASLFGAGLSGADDVPDVADVLAQATIVDGFTARAQQLGTVHAAAPRLQNHRMVDPRVLDGLRKAAADAERNLAAALEGDNLGVIADDLEALAVRIRAAAARLEKT